MKHYKPTPTTRFLREGEYNKRVGKSAIRWLTHSSNPQKAGTILVSSDGTKLYTVQGDGSLRLHEVNNVRA